MTVKQITAVQGRTLTSPHNAGLVLRADAALAWERAVAKFGRAVLVTGAWRSLDSQVWLFTARYVQGNHSGKPGFTNDVRKWNGVVYTRKAGTAAAAVPGTSNHGGGVAVDVKTGRGPGDPASPVAVVFTGWSDPDRAEFLTVAAEFGWADDEGRAVDEFWHLTYYPDRDKHRGVPEVLPVTGRLDKTTITAWQAQLGVPATGILDAPTISQVQRVLNAKNGHGGFRLKRPLTVHGRADKRTWQAIQKVMNVWAKRTKGRRIVLKGALFAINGKPTKRVVQGLQKSLRNELWK